MSEPAGIHVVDQPGIGPLVVLVHGTLDRSTSFTKCRAERDGLRTVAYDRRGYGRSVEAAPPAESIDDHIDDLVAVIGDRPAVVAGHSYGGDVALGAAIERPDLVRAVACWEAPMPWLPGWPADSAGGLASEIGEREGPEAAAEHFFRHLVGDHTWDQLPARTQAARRTEGRALLTDLRSIRSAPPFDLDAVKVPVVVGHGSASRPHHIAASPALAASLADAELWVIDGAAHGAHASHPAAFAAFIRRAVERSGL